MNFRKGQNGKSEYVAQAVTYEALPRRVLLRVAFCFRVLRTLGGRILLVAL